MVFSMRVNQGNLEVSLFIIIEGPRNKRKCPEKNRTNYIFLAVKNVYQHIIIVCERRNCHKMGKTTTTTTTKS